MGADVHKDAHSFGEEWVGRFVALVAGYGRELRAAKVFSAAPAKPQTLGEGTVGDMDGHVHDFGQAADFRDIPLERGGDHLTALVQPLYAVSQRRVPFAARKARELSFPCFLRAANCAILEWTAWTGGANTRPPCGID